MKAANILVALIWVAWGLFVATYLAHEEDERLREARKALRR